MLDKPVPVPSKGALRALRQAVLYSSAGVAAGAAVLLAEERRRRICTARKIVENARILRSSERYIHAAAVAAPSRNEMEDMEISPMFPQEYGREALRHPLSAAEIDKAYERATTRLPKERRRQSTQREHPDSGATQARDRDHDSQMEVRASKGRFLDMSKSLHDMQSQSFRERKACTDPVAEAFSDAFGDQPLVRLPAKGERFRTCISEAPPRGRRLKGLPIKTAPAIEPALSAPQAASHILEAINAGRAGCALQRFYAFYKAGVRYAEPESLEADRRLWLTARKHLAEENIIQVVDKFFSLFPPTDGSTARPPLEIARVLLELTASACAIATGKLSESLEALFNCICTLGGITYSCLSFIHEALVKLIRICRQSDAVDLFARTVGQFLLNDTVDRDPDIKALTLKIQRDVFEAAGDSRSFTKINDWLKALPNNQLHVQSWIDCVLAKCEHHLAESDLARATRTLTNGLQPGKLDASGTLCVEMARKLFDAAAQSELAALTRHVLSWLHAQGREDPLCAFNVLKSCQSYKQRTKRQQNHRIIVNLFMRYRGRMETPKIYYPGICAAFADTGPFEECAKVITALTNATVGSKLFEACQSSYAVLLSRVWSQTRNLKAVQSVLETMVSAMGEQGVPIDVYNAVALARVRAGQSFPADSELYDSPIDRKVKPDVATFGHLMLSRAYADDWTAVREILKQVREAGMITTSTRMGPFFNPVFKRFCNRHNSEDVRRFLQEAIHSCGIRPTQQTADIVFEALVREQRLSEIEPWVESMRTQGFDVTVNAHSVFRMFKRFFLENRPPHQLLIQLLKRLDDTANRSLFSTELYSIISGSLAFDLSKARPKTRTILQPVIKRNLKRVTRKAAHAPEITNPAYVKQRQTETNMILALAWDRPEEAMKLYRENLPSGLPASVPALEMAMEASHRAEHGSPHEAYEELAKAKAAGMNVRPSLGAFLLHRMYRERLEDQQIESMVMDFYRTMAENGFEIKHYIAVSGANYLVNKGRPTSAVNLLRSIYESEWARRKPLDIVGMTVFLRAYAAAKDLRGVQWVLETVFSTNMRIDRGFHQALRMARKPFFEADDGRRSESEAIIDSRIRKRFDRWLKLCMARRRAQANRTRTVGFQMVDTIKRLADRPLIREVIAEGSSAPMHEIKDGSSPDQDAEGVEALPPSVPGVASSAENLESLEEAFPNGLRPQSSSKRSKRFKRLRLPEGDTERLVEGLNL